MSTQKVKRRVSWNTKEYEEAYFFFLIMLNCAIYNVILLCIIFSSYYSLFTLHRSFYPKCNIMLLFLNRARVDNNRSGRVSNYISFARNCIPYYIFSSTSRIDESNQQTTFRQPLASKQGIIANIQWFEHNRGRQCVHNIGCKGGRVILWSFRRVIKHLGKCSYSIHVTHAFSSIQIHILFNVRCYDRTWSLAWKLNNMFGRAICDKKCKTSKGLTRIQNRSDVSKHLTQLIFVLFII